MASFLRAFTLFFAITPAFVAAQKPLTLDDVDVGLPEITVDEPFAAEFSAEKAAEYLDRSALNWQKTKKCATCHTNLFYMAARPALKSIRPDSGEVRSFYEDYPEVRWEKKALQESQGFWSIVVGTGLTLNDVQTTGKLSDVSRKALDIMWTVQREDGGWKWPHCDYAPLEIDDHYGVTLAALTVGLTPDEYKETPQAREGLEQLRKYLVNNPPKSLHHRAMLAWSSIRVDGIATEEERQKTLSELLALQLDDGGWSTAGFLTDWKELVSDNGGPLDTKISDGYGTGFVIVVARELGVSADDPRLQRGIDWIHKNQRESGKWFTRSPVHDCGNLISNVGSAYAILALQACGELEGWPFASIKPVIEKSSSEIRETEHFWYRLAPEGPYIDSQRDNKAFGFRDDKIFLSEDNGNTWAHSATFADAENIGFSCILKNGNIVFATRQKLFLSTDNLKSHREIIVKDDGEDYLPHTPQDPDQPGWYFHPLDGVHTWDIEGQEVLVWGNYCNVLGGAVPVNIYYSTDSGETVEIAYSFGRNPKFQEKGVDPKLYLGDPKNSYICRHIHSVVFNPAEQAFYACTGDINRGHGDECHWMRGTYDLQADEWDWQILVSVNSNSRYKSGGISFYDGQLYWAADANGPKLPTEKYDRGIFRCDPEDLADPKKHTLLFNAEFEMANMIIEDDVIIAGHCAPASTFKTGIAYSPDLGETWAEYDLPQFGARSPARFHPKNSDGWFRVDLRTGWISRGEVLFIKPKP